VNLHLGERGEVRVFNRKGIESIFVSHGLSFACRLLGDKN